MVFGRTLNPNSAPLGIADASAPTFDPVLLRPQVLQMVGVGRTTLFKLIKAKKFPEPLRLSERIRGWRLSTVEKYLASLEVQS
ncbi:helix-turn-helix transcriptional regulator [Caballeronia udeis]|uniref:helix-turn-helix transcriptional regulator n=1 Tax=Caballeronia udeis TaxID=1232866 RepID=UPI00384EDBA7